MSSGPSERAISDLTPDEIEWLEHHRELLAAIIEQEQLPLPERATVLDACDAVVRWWHAQPETDRPDANMIVHAVGIGYGDALADVFELEWKIVEDGAGTSLALWRQDPEILASPIDSVAGRFAASPDGFVAELYDSVATQLDQIIDASEG